MVFSLGELAKSRKEESSFCEQKEAKKLFTRAARLQALAPSCENGQSHERTFFGSFSKKTSLPSYPSTSPAPVRSTISR
jgi:hypothetical protein